MKNIFAILLIAASFSAYPQHDHNAHASTATKEKQAPTFKDDKLGSAYSHYIHLKNALVESNAEGTKAIAVELEKALSAVSGGKKAQEAAKNIASSSDIKEQRKSFSTLSSEMTTLVKSGKLANGSLYVVYCPMANKNEGGFWLSNEKEIKNPYFGNMMLTCGSVKETIQ